MTAEKIGCRCNVLPGLESLRQDEVLCDCTLLSVEGTRFPVHRVVLASCSDFFRGLFLHRENVAITTCEDDTIANSESSDSERVSKYKEKSTKESPAEIRLQVTSDLLSLFVQFAYTGGIEDLSFWQVERLLPLADKWLIPGIVDICCGVLERNLAVDNCIGIWRFAGAYRCADLEQKSRRFILYHIWWMLIHGESTEAFGLKTEELKSLLSDDWLNVPSENGVFLLIRKWITRNQTKRIPGLPKLLTEMRLGLCSTDFIEETLVTDYFFQSCDTASVVLQGARDQLSTHSLDLTLTTKLLRPRIPQNILFAVGGWSDRSPTSCIETYDSKSDRWFLLTSTDSNPRAYHGVAFINRKIYVVGGFDGTDYYNSVRYFDPETMKWAEAAPMHFARCYVSVAVLDNQIYAIGGFDSNRRLTSAEKFNPERNQWTLISPMNRERSDASAAAFRGKIYVAGGFNGHEVLRSVEVYSPNENIWFMVADTLSPRSGVSMVADSSNVYVIGGFNGHCRLTSGEKYDPESLSWKNIGEMKTARSNFTAVILDGKIFVIGGFNGHTTTGEVESYDPTTDEWEEVRAMNVHRSAVEACVVSDLPDPEKFSFYGHHSTTA